MSIENPPRAFLTDVFGTVVDWRTTTTNKLIASAHEALNSSASSIPSTVRTAATDIDWGAFAQLWRISYYKFTRGYDPNSGISFKPVDEHHLDSLKELLEQHSLTGLWDDVQLRDISMVWHFLDPWPDSSSGLGQLNKKFETATLSNGNTSLLQDLATHGNLPYKHILSAQDFGAYKPHPSVYNGAAERLGLETGQCALVAAHLNDLQAAKGCGYQTVYIRRAREEEWPSEKVEQARKDGWVDMWIEEGEGGFEEMARRFGI